MAALSPTAAMVVRPGKYPLSLGSVTFSTEETPQKLSIGSGDQQLVVHFLPGGGRIVQDFGNSAAEVTWTGRFFGPNIAPRVQQLRTYRISGQPQTLSFKSERYLVKIKSFDPGYRGGFNEYKITCVVIQDQNGAFSVASTTSVDQQVAALQSQAQTQNNAIIAIDQTGSASYQQSLTNLQASIAQYTPLASNVVPGATAILTQLAEAVGAVTTYQSSISSTSEQTPYVVGLLASLNAIGANVQSSQAIATVQTIGGDLFTVAATQYGDVSQAFNLAAANGLVHPLLPSTVVQTIAIPPAQTS